MRGLLVGNRAPPAFKEQALGSRRAERASSEKADRSEQANQASVREGELLHFPCAGGIFEAKTSGATPPTDMKTHAREKRLSGGHRHVSTATPHQSAGFLKKPAG